MARGPINGASLPLDSMTDIIETDVALVRQVGDERAVKFTQTITDEFLDSIKERSTGLNDPTGEFLYVGSVPAAIVDKWMREGYDVYHEPVQTSLARLRAEDLTKFVATSKRI